MPPVQTTIRCSNCGQPVQAILRTLIDASSDPQGKSLLLNGYLNVAPCPHCGAMNKVETPLLYHDGSKELLLAYVPPQIGIREGGEEKIVGGLLNDLTRSLPQGAFKAYMFNPRRVLTLQGMIDQILQADGVTPEMLEAQRKRVELAGKLLETDPDKRAELIKQYDSSIDREFFQTLTLMAQRMMQAGEDAIADAIIELQNQLVESSSYGQVILKDQEEQELIIREVAGELQRLGQQATRQDIIQLVIRYADKPHHIEALIGLARPAFDYQFFQEFTAQISKAPASDRPRLEAVRQRLVDLSARADQQAQAAFRQAAQLLQQMLAAKDPDELIQAALPLIDDVFMTVLEANIREAERRSDLQSSARLKEVQSKIIAALQSQMQPELRFVDELLNLESDDEIRSRISEHAADFGPELLEVIDAVHQILEVQGQRAMLARLSMIREEAATALG